MKNAITDPTVILKDSDSLESFGVNTSAGDFLGVLYVRPSEQRRPSWVTFFDKALDVRKIPASSQSSAAALLIQRGEYAYAVTFGYGRNLLADGVADERFGLRVTLNAIDPNKVRSIDKTTFAEVSRHSREQVSTASGFESFGLDVEQDLLRAVTGKPADPSLGAHLTGKDALVVTAPITIDSLGAALDLYRELGQKDDYRERYPWVDNISEVSDRDLVRELDTIVAKRIQHSRTENIWLAPAEIIDWSDFGGFKYRDAEGAPTFPELLLEDYLDDCREPADLTAERLRTDRVRYISAETDDVKFTWSIRRCVCAELPYRDEIFVLSEGAWYRIDPTFAEMVDGSVQDLPNTTIKLPPFRDEDEEAYNRRAHEKSDGALALMDQVRIPIGGPRGSVEFCDLFSAGGALIHVKRYRGRSSSLSHMFAQGMVAARLFVTDAEFRELVNERLPPSHRLADPRARIDAEVYEVAFAVIELPGKSLRLPFFSKVNLRNTRDFLSGFGFPVTLTPVPFVSE